MHPRISGPAATRRSWITGPSLLLIAGCFGAWALFLARYGVDVPRQDQLDTPARQLLAYADGELRPADLIVQHNESRKVVPVLISLGLFALQGSYDVRTEQLVAFAMCALAVLLVARLAWLSTRDTTSTALLAALFTSLLWSAHTREFHLWSNNLERLVPLLCLLALLAAFVGRGVTWGTTLLASALCLAAQFGYADGAATWGLAAAYLALAERRELRRRLPKLGALLALGAASSLLYFHDYGQPSHAPAPDLGEAAPGLLGPLRFALRFLGNAVTSSNEPLALFWGGVALGGYALAVWRVAAGRGEPRARPAQIAWILLGAYSLLQATVVTVTRLPLGMLHATRDDYVTYPSGLYTAAAALLLTTTSARTTRRIAVFVLLFACGLSLTLASPRLWGQLARHRQVFEHARACWLLMHHHVDEACLDRLYPPVDGRLARLERAGPLLCARPLEALVFGEPADGAVTARSLEDGLLRIEGWARVRGAPADAVVLVDIAAQRVVAVAGVGLLRGSAPADAWRFQTSCAAGGCDALRVFAMSNARAELRPLRE